MFGSEDAYGSSMVTGERPSSMAASETISATVAQEGGPPVGAGGGGGGAAVGGGGSVHEFVTAIRYASIPLTFTAATVICGGTVQPASRRTLNRKPPGMSVRTDPAS